MNYLIAALLIGLTSSLAAPVAPAAIVKLETPFALKIGASAKLVNWSVTFVRVSLGVLSTPCGPEMTCLPQDMVIELRVTRDRVSRTVMLHTSLEPRSAIALRQRVTLVGLDAKPATVATFKVSKP